ncbi:hypothetical protein PROFUN_10973, partial [Planoprotostelium fungivorum]
ALDSPGYARFGISAISYACSLLLGPSSGRWTMIERWDLFNHQQHWTLSYQRPRLRILRFFLRQNTIPKRLEIDARAILFAWMLSFGPLGSQDHITSYDLMSITNKTPPDQLETTRIAFYATFYARRPILTPGQPLFGQHMTLDSNSTLNSTPEDPFLSHKRTKLSHETTPKRLEIDAWAILFAWMLSFGPLGSQDHITSYDLMSITNKTPPDQLETTRIAFYATFYARRPILTPGQPLFGQHMTLDSNSTLNSTPEDPFLSHKRTKLSHEVRSHLTSTPTLVLPRAHLLSTHTRFTLRATSALSLLLDRDLALRIARPFLLVYQPGTLNWPYPGHLTGLSARPLRATPKKLRRKLRRKEDSDEDPKPLDEDNGSLEEEAPKKRKNQCL